MKIPKWRHELVRCYKQGKLVCYFLNNAAKTCIYGLKISENIEIGHLLKISENIEIGHFFQSRAFFHLCVAIFTQVASAPLKLLIFRPSVFLINFPYSFCWYAHLSSPNIIPVYLENVVTRSNYFFVMLMLLAYNFRSSAKKNMCYIIGSFNSVWVPFNVS